MAKYREIILKDGRKVFIDNKGNIVESGTFQQPTGENGDTGKQSLASLPVDNSVKPTKVDLLNIDLGDTNKSDGSAIVETPVENTVRRTPATPRRRTASTPVKRTQTSTPAKVVDKRNGSTVTVESNKKASDSTAVKTKTSTPITPAKGYYKGTRYSKNGNYKFVHDGKGKYKVYIKSNNSSGWNHIYTRKRGGSVSEDEMESITMASQNSYFSNQYNNKTGRSLTSDEVKLRTQTKGDKTAIQQKKYNLPTTTQRILNIQSKQGLENISPEFALLTLGKGFKQTKLHTQKRLPDQLRLEDYRYPVVRNSVNNSLSSRIKNFMSRFTK